MTLLASLFRISQQKPRKHEPHEMICGGPVRVSRILRSLKRVQPLLTCYAGISQCVLTAAVSAHRGTAKLLSTLFRLFAELAEKVNVRSWEPYCWFRTYTMCVGSTLCRPNMCCSFNKSISTFLHSLGIM